MEQVADHPHPLLRPAEHRGELDGGRVPPQLVAHRHLGDVEEPGLAEDRLAGLALGLLALDRCGDVELDDPAHVRLQPGGVAVARGVFADRRDHGHRRLLVEVADVDTGIGVGEGGVERDHEVVLDERGTRLVVALAVRPAEQLGDLLERQGRPRPHLRSQAVEGGVDPGGFHQRGTWPALRPKRAANCSTARATSRRAAPPLARSTAPESGPPPTL